MSLWIKLIESETICLQPSVNTFTEVIFNEPEPTEFYDSPMGDFIFIERTKLNKDIEQISQKIFQMLPSRVKMVIESRSYDRISADSAASMGKGKLKCLLKLL